MSEDTTESLRDSDDKLTLILTEVRNLNARMESFENRMERLEKRQDELEAKVDARLIETRPIWEAVLARLTAIEQHQESMGQRQESMERRLRWISDELKDLKSRFRPVLRDVEKLILDGTISRNAF
jgi:chromosome segregation ATPase